MKRLLAWLGIGTWVWVKYHNTVYLCMVRSSPWGPTVYWLGKGWCDPQYLRPKGQTDSPWMVWAPYKWKEFPESTYWIDVLSLMAK